MKKIVRWNTSFSARILGMAAALIFSAGAMTACQSQPTASTADYIGIDAAKDAALKAADVTLRKFYGPPTETNFAGGLLTGDQAACKAACEAFADVVQDVAQRPKDYE